MISQAVYRDGPKSRSSSTLLLLWNIIFIGSWWWCRLDQGVSRSRWVVLIRWPILPISFRVDNTISYWLLYSRNKCLRLRISIWSYSQLNTSYISLWFSRMKRQSNVFKALFISLLSLRVRECISILVNGLVLNRWIINLLFRGRNTISSVITSCSQGMLVSQRETKLSIIEKLEEWVEVADALFMPGMTLWWIYRFFMVRWENSQLRISNLQQKHNFSNNCFSKYRYSKGKREVWQFLTSTNINGLKQGLRKESS